MLAAAQNLCEIAATKQQRTLVFLHEDFLEHVF